MTASTPKLLADTIFAEIVAACLNAVLAALGGLRLSEFLRDQLEAEITQGLVEDRGIAPQSSYQEDEPVD